MPLTRGRILLLSVGMGRSDYERESLINPLLKSIGSEPWTRVILLPSQESLPSAETVRAESPVQDTVIKSLPEARQEENADACFDHYRKVIEQEIDQGAGPGSIVVDFTRGTKAMSAALVLAAVRCDIPVVRYLGAEPGGRDDANLVKPGKERIVDIVTTMATAWKRLDAADRFFQHGNFSAAAETTSETNLFPDDELRDAARFGNALANVYATWDRLDYRAAWKLMEGLDSLPAHQRFQCYMPTPEQRNLLQALATEFDRNNHAAMATQLRRICADLLANAERRLRDGQFEDAYVRAYRILELVGQARLFENNLDSSNIPADHPAALALNKKMSKKNKGDSLPCNKHGQHYLAREHAARFLKQLSDPLGKTLLTLADELYFISNRNHSILIHGFTTAGTMDALAAQAELARLEKLLHDDSPTTAPHQLAAARAMRFGAR